MKGSKAIGYCVYVKEDTTAQILDFVATPRPRNCLRLLVEHSRREQVARLAFRGIRLRMWMITMWDSDW